MVDQNIWNILELPPGSPKGEAQDVPSNAHAVSAHETRQYRNEDSESSSKLNSQRWQSGRPKYLEYFGTAARQPEGRGTGCAE